MNTNRPRIFRMLNAKLLVHVALLIFQSHHPLKTDIIMLSPGRNPGCKRSGCITARLGRKLSSPRSLCVLSSENSVVFFIQGWEGNLLWLCINRNSQTKHIDRMLMPSSSEKYSQCTLENIGAEVQTAEKSSSSSFSYKTVDQHNGRYHFCCSIALGSNRATLMRSSQH